MWQYETSRKLKKKKKSSRKQGVSQWHHCNGTKRGKEQMPLVYSQFWLGAVANYRHFVSNERCSFELKPPPPSSKRTHTLHPYGKKCWPTSGIVYVMRYTGWCLDLRSILEKACHVPGSTEGLFSCFFLSGVGAYLSPFVLRSLTALATVRDHEDRESAPQKTSIKICTIIVWVRDGASGRGRSVIRMWCRCFRRAESCFSCLRFGLFWVWFIGFGSSKLNVEQCSC